MTKILVGYGSLTGNTQSVAEKLVDLLRGQAHAVTLKNLEEIKPSELTEYSTLLLGASTWDDGQLPPDAQFFYDALTQQPTDLSQTKYAVFGCGDRSYETYCVAVDSIDELLAANHSTKIGESLKIDGFPEMPENIAAFENWATALLAALKA